MPIDADFYKHSVKVLGGVRLEAIINEIVEILNG